MGSQSMKRLENASHAVRKATDNLVKAAQQAIDEQGDDPDSVALNTSAVNNVVEEINARSEVLRMEKELEMARSKLEKLHKRKYNTDSETEQSGYESSGYDEASFRRVYSPYQKLPPQQFQQPHQQQQQQHQQQQQQSFRTEEQHTIESGPSFNESLERFRIATSSGGESDGGGGACGDFSPSPAGKTSSVFRQRQQQQQQHYSATTTFSQRTTRAMEEQRTMITRSSQKSYHIE